MPSQPGQPEELAKYVCHSLVVSDTARIFWAAKAPAALLAEGHQVADGCLVGRTPFLSPCAQCLLVFHLNSSFPAAFLIQLHQQCHSSFSWTILSEEDDRLIYLGLLLTNCLTSTFPYSVDSVAGWWRSQPSGQLFLPQTLSFPVLILVHTWCMHDLWRQVWKSLLKGNWTGMVPAEQNFSSACPLVPLNFELWPGLCNGLMSTPWQPLQDKSSVDRTLKSHDSQRHSRLAWPVRESSLASLRIPHHSGSFSQL